MKKSLILISGFFLSIILSFNSLHSQSEFQSNVISIGVVASDLEASFKFYTEIIGMKETGGFNIDEDFAQRSGLTPGIPFEVKILKLEDSPQANQWKLLSFGKKKRKGKKFINQGLGLRYVTLYYNSLDAVLERIKANNIKMLGETPTRIADGRGFILIQDPDGVLVELIGKLKE